MKRIALILLSLILFLGAALPSGALAEGLPLPERPTLPAGISLKANIRRRRAVSTTFVTLAEPVLGQEARWRVDAGVQYQFDLLMYNPDEDVYNYIYMGQGFSVDSVFAYTIREPGEYYLSCNILNEDGSLSYDGIDFEVAERAGAMSAAARAAQIVAECSETGEYARALWLHDWLTGHAHYDINYSYYGPDGVLFLGKGVCDSYAKAYVYLLQAAGIDVMRITGMANGGNHAWNAVKIDGQWCMVDVTWDDPTTASDYNDEPVSGYEGHDYFGINETLLLEDHTIGEDSPYVACTTLDNLYARREGTYRIWMSHIWTTFEENLAEGQLDFGVDTDSRIMAEQGGYYDRNGSDSLRRFVDRQTRIACMLMSEDEWTIPGDRPVRADFTYDTTVLKIFCDVPVEGVDVLLPAGLKLLDESAFENAASIHGVRLPEGVERIAAGAFGNCDALMWVVIPGGELEIDDHAFDGVPEGFVIVTPAGSAADSYAARNGITRKNM